MGPHLPALHTLSHLALGYCPAVEPPSIESALPVKYAGIGDR